MSEFRKFFNVDQRQSDNTSQKCYNGSWSWAGIVKAVVSNSYKAIDCYAYLLKAIRSWVFFLLKKCMRDWIITLILYLDVCLFSLTEGQWQEIKKRLSVQILLTSWLIPSFECADVSPHLLPIAHRVWHERRVTPNLPSGNPVKWGAAAGCN